MIAVVPAPSRNQASAPTPQTMAKQLRPQRRFRRRGRNGLEWLCDRRQIRHAEARPRLRRRGNEDDAAIPRGREGPDGWLLADDGDFRRRSVGRSARRREGTPAAASPVSARPAATSHAHAGRRYTALTAIAARAKTVAATALDTAMLKKSSTAIPFQRCPFLPLPLKPSSSMRSRSS